MAEKITQLYGDKEKQLKIYPKTKIAAIIDDSYNTGSQEEKTLKNVLDSIKGDIATASSNNTTLSESLKKEEQDRKKENESVRAYVDKLAATMESVGYDEVLDIRKGYDNTQYSSAGEAVRSQILDVRNYINSFDNLPEIAETQIDAILNNETVVDDDGGSSLVTEASEEEINAIIGG